MCPAGDVDDPASLCHAWCQQIGEQEGAVMIGNHVPIHTTRAIRDAHHTCVTKSISVKTG